MVSMCAGCNVYEPWAAIIVGVGAGFAFIGVHFAMLKFQVENQLHRLVYIRFIVLRLGSGSVSQKKRLDPYLEKGRIRIRSEYPYSK